MANFDFNRGYGCGYGCVCDCDRDCRRYLVDLGADIGAKTSNGGTVLWWAKRMLDAGHPVIEYLEGIGAPEEGEDL